MRLQLNYHSGEPIWRQIVEQIKFKIASNDIRPGEKLPSLRALASQLKINPRTVVKSYDELRHQGLVVMRQGQGVFVAARGSHASAATRRKIIRDMARRLLAEASRLGGDPDEVMKILQEVSGKIGAAR